VATLPDHRRAWGMAMHAELAEVRGRSARWRFALSSARAVPRLPPLGGWPVLALMTGVAAAAVAAAGPAVAGEQPAGTALIGLPFAVICAAAGRHARPPVARAHHAATTIKP